MDRESWDPYIAATFGRRKVLDFWSILKYVVEAWGDSREERASIPPT